MATKLRAKPLLIQDDEPDQELIEFLKANKLETTIKSVLSTGLNLSHFIEMDESDLEQLLSQTLKLSIPSKIKFKHEINVQIF